ncbi:MAG: alpha/beta hydrolase [Holdemanella sp.]|nr:alpha/beta hydrolase [Holdemanella sp.]
MIPLIENTDVTLSEYLCKTDIKIPLILICPGGGYLGCTPNEGKPVANFFNQKGFHSAVLNYSQKKSNPKTPAYPQFLYDLEKAYSIIVENEETWKVDIESIYLLGFSAGAHLCSLYGNLWNTDFFITHRKPKGILLCYPVVDVEALGHNETVNMQHVISDMKETVLHSPFIQACIKALFGHYPITKEEYNLVNSTAKINEDTPSTFIWQTFNDEIIDVSKTIEYVNALYKKKIACEFHLFDKGIHGISLATEDVTKHLDMHIQHWTQLAIEWINRNQ